MGILMKNGVNYTGFGAKNIAIAHYDSIGIPQVFFSDKAGNKINCGMEARYITTITSDPIAFFKWKWEDNGTWAGYGAVSLRQLNYGTDYSHNNEHADLVDPVMLSVNGVTAYVYKESGGWAFSNNPNVVINDTYNITNLYATDSDISSSSKFVKDIVATLLDGYTLPQEAVVRYSTVERAIGTWIDGSTVYEKTFDLGSDLTVSQSNWTSTGVSVGDIGKVLSIWAMTSAGTCWGDLSVALNINSYINLLCARNGNTEAIRYFTLQYIKSS